MQISQETIDKIIKFRAERDGKQFHNPKDLAISLNLEASELLELFQWSGKDLQCINNKNQMAEELADIVIYAILFSESCGIDLEVALNNKLQQNTEKYPVEKCRGKSNKHSDL